MKYKSHYDNPWGIPLQGLDFDLEGPDANYLMDASHIYGRVVYQDVHASPEEWKLISENEAKPYLPARTDSLKVKLGIEARKTVDIGTFEHVKFENIFKYKRGFLINTGGSIWGLDFVPKPVDDKDISTQYLAVAGYKGAVEEHISVDEIQPTGTYKNAIQIWKLKLTTQIPSQEPIMDLCLLHDFGVIYDLKWCPYGTFEDEESVHNGMAKLGILAIACGDGTIRTIVVPHPTAVRKHMCSQDMDPSATVYMRIENSRCTFLIKGTKSLTFSWGGHDKLAAGYTNGNVVVWDMVSALADAYANQIDKSKRHIQLSSQVSDSTVRCISWNGIDKPERLLFGGFDGRLMVLDTNDPCIPLSINRARGIMAACGWASHTSAMFFVDGDNISKGFAFNEDGSPSMFKYGEMPGLCWDIALSEHHGQFALCSGTGWVRTSNMYQLKSRNLLISQNTIYKLEYDEETGTYRYVDGIGPQSLDDGRKLETYQMYGDSHRSIQKVVWNPNKYTSAFIASGGAAGLCRIEFEGRGPDWK